jgi:predicted GNAT family N-acyltransferase
VIDIFAPEPLSPAHRTGDFHCGVPSLDSWLHERALTNHSRHFSQVFVSADRFGVVLAYYTLSTAAIVRSSAPSAIRRNAPDPVPAMMIGRLAVTESQQGQCLGQIIVKDALARCARVSQETAFAAVLVNPVDAAAKRFWERFTFCTLPGDPGTMYLPTSALADVI